MESSSIDPVTGVVTYTPDPDFFGIDSLEYSVCDTGLPVLCDTAWIFITITPVNDPPIAPPDTVYTPEDSTVTFCPLDNDFDVEGPLDTATTDTCAGGGPANGTLVFDPVTCTWDYTPDPGFNGIDSICYVVCDTGSPVLCDTGTIIIIIAPENDPPVAINDTTTTLEETPVDIDPLVNDFDIEGPLDSTTVTELTPPTNGTSSIDPVTGVVTYTPDPDFFGIDSLEYSVCDTGLPVLCDTAWILITITPVNDPPIAPPDTFFTPEDSMITFCPLDNDFDVEGPLDTATTDTCAGGGPANGTLVFDPVTCTWDYTPDPGFNGIDSICYVICDTGSPVLCDTGTIIIIIAPENDPPVAINDTTTTLEETPVDIDPLVNDFDIEGPLDSTTVTELTPPTNGTTSIDPVTGVVTYTPDPDFFGIDSLEYSVCDTGLPVLCDTAWIFITITPVNDPPIAPPDTLYTPEDSTITFCPLDNDFDPEGPLDTATTDTCAGGGPANGTLVFDPVTCTWDYTPDPGFNGIDSICYVICDTGSPVLCDTGTIIIIIAPINDPPVAINDTTTTAEETPVDIDPLVNDFDIDGPLDSTTVTELTPPTNGTSSIDPVTGVVTYTPDPDFFGIDSLEYSVCDTGLPVLCDTAWIFITITPVNDPPIAPPDTLYTPEDSTITFCPLDNDFDPEGPLDTATTDTCAGGGPANGTLVFDPVTCTWEYTPDPGFNGIDSICYVICDTGSPVLCDTGTIIIIIAPINDPPVAINDTTTTAEETPVDIDPLVNDFDIDGPLDSTTVTELTPPTNGTSSIDPLTGVVTYTPDPDFFGIDSLEYSVCDTGLPVLCDTAWIFITITPVNDPPIAPPDTFYTPEDSMITFCPLDNDFDPEGPLDTATTDTCAGGGPANGTLVFDPVTCTWEYTPDPGFSGVDSICYVVCDTGSPVWCDTGTIIIIIAPVNDPPVAINDTTTTAEDTPVDIDPLVNDFDIDGPLDSTTVTELTPPTNGTSSIDPVTGVVTYTPDPDFFGIDSLEYSVCDTGLPVLCDTALDFHYHHSGK